jgi:hypothetical protein
MVVQEHDRVKMLKLLIYFQRYRQRCYVGSDQQYLRCSHQADRLCRESSSTPALPICFHVAVSHYPAIAHAHTSYYLINDVRPPHKCLSPISGKLNVAQSQSVHYSSHVRRVSDAVVLRETRVIVERLLGVSVRGGEYRQRCA